MSSETLAPNVPSTSPQTSEQRILWRMQGPRRVIRAVLQRGQFETHELIVAFEDTNEVIETQSDPWQVHALLQRSEALRQVLVEKGLKPIQVP